MRASASSAAVRASMAAARAAAASATRRSSSSARSRVARNAAANIVWPASKTPPISRSSRRDSCTSVRVRRQASRLAFIRWSVSASPPSSLSRKARSSEVSAREMPPVMLVRSISLSLLRSSSVPSRSGVTPWSKSAAK